jgi:hypothetical protein
MLYRMWGGRTGADGSGDLVETTIRREMERYVIFKVTENGSVKWLILSV